MCQTAPLCLDQHPNYIRVDGKPAFAIYRIGLIAAEGALKPMLTLWRQLAVEAGLRGLHIVGTIGGHEPREQAATSLWGQGVDAGFHFVPSLSWAFDSSSLDEGKVATTTNLPVGVEAWMCSTGAPRQASTGGHAYPTGTPTGAGRHAPPPSQWASAGPTSPPLRTSSSRRSSLEMASAPPFVRCPSNPRGLVHEVDFQPSA